MKRMQEPPGGREQAIIIWNTTREMPAASGTVNAAQVRQGGAEGGRGCRLRPPARSMPPR